MGGGLTRRELVRNGLLGAGLVATASWALPEAVFGQGATVTNLVRNPRVANGLTGWTAFVEKGAAPALLTHRTDDGLAPATTCAEVTFTSTSDSHRGAAMIARGGSWTMPCVQGQVLWAQAAGKMVSGGPNSELWLTIGYYNSQGTLLIDRTLQKLSAKAGVWQVLRGFDTAPQSAVRCHVAVWLAETPQTNSVLRVTDAMVVADPPTMPSYFDGDQPGCTWGGLPHSSVSIAPAPAPAAPARAGFLAGWNDNSVLHTGWSYQRDADLNRDIGMSVLRVGCDLRGGWVTPNTNTIDWNTSYAKEIDQLNTACAAYGIKLLPIAMGAPPWMLSPNADQSKINPPDPTHNQDWAGICQQMASRWGSNLAGIEIWNEPNLATFWAPGADPVGYANLLIAAKSAIPAGVPVIVGGLSGTTANVAASGSTVHTGLPGIVGGINGTTSKSQPAAAMAVGDFISAMLNAGAGGHFDGLAVHPYPGHPSSGTFDNSMRATRAALAGGGVSAPIWVTEIGISTTGKPAAATEAQQATVNRLLYAMLKRQSDVQAVCWHTSVSSTAATGSGIGFEFVERSTGRHKPVYDAIKSEIAGEP